MVKAIRNKVAGIAFIIIIIIMKISVGDPDAYSRNLPPRHILCATSSRRTGRLEEQLGVLVS